MSSDHLKSCRPAVWAALLFTVLALPSVLVGCSKSADPSVAEQAASEQTDMWADPDAARERLNRSEGGRLVLRSIEAHGGLDAWYSAPTSSYTWEYANVGADLQFESFLVADNRTRRIYHDLLTLGSYGDPDPVDARFAWTGSEAWMHPASIERINPRFWASTGYYFEQIPFVLADPGLNYEVLQDDSLEGQPYRMVRVSYDDGVGDAPEDTYTLYLDPDTHQVRAIRYTVTYGRDVPPDAEPRETLFFYEDYTTVDGLTVPRHFRGFGFENGTRGDFKNEAWADSISFSRPFNEARLTAPEGARFAPAPEGG